MGGPSRVDGEPAYRYRFLRAVPWPKGKDLALEILHRDTRTAVLFLEWLYDSCNLHPVSGFDNPLT